MSLPSDGPWKKGKMNDSDKIYDANGQVIAYVTGATRGRRVSPRHAQSQANARLMASAPEMLQLLKSLLPQHREGDCYSNDYMGRCICGREAVIALIKKIERV